MDRVNAYIDGFNLYHSLKDQGWSKYYWLDIPSLLQGLLKDNQVINTVFYFTSPSVEPASLKRQTTYIEALERVSLTKNRHLQVVRGRFESDDVKCSVCNDYIRCQECGQIVSFNHEKETDVNIAVQMLSDAYEDAFDVALLITADSDQVGTIRTIKKFFYDTKKVGVVFPPKRESKHLIKVADFVLHISQNDLGKNQLPEIVEKHDGYKLQRPNTWI